MAGNSYKSDPDYAVLCMSVHWLLTVAQLLLFGYLMDAATAAVAQQHGSQVITAIDVLRKKVLLDPRNIWSPPVTPTIGMC